MGACNSVTSHKKEQRPTATTASNRENSPQSLHNQQSQQPKPEKKFNPHSLINEISNQIVIKHINDINGDAVKINKCTDSTIIIMDNSAQVIINECSNCNFFIAPCKGSISMRKSENMRIIAASQQFRCGDVENVYASLYCLTEPSLDKTKNFHLSCFYFMYTELPDLFSKAELSVWDNCWSEFHDYSPDSEGKRNIHYFDARSDENFMNFYSSALRDQEISVDQYYPVPLTQGLSFFTDKDMQNNNNTNTQMTQMSQMKHLFVFFRECCVDQLKIYELLNDETLRSLSCSMIKTALVEKTDKFVVNLQDTLKRNKNMDKYEFFNASVNSNINNASRGSVNASGVGNMQTNKANQGGNTFGAGVVTNSPTMSNGFVLLWLVNEEDNFGRFIEIIENEFDNILYVNEEDIGKMEEYIKRLFKNFTLPSA